MPSPEPLRATMHTLALCPACVYAMLPSGTVVSIATTAAGVPFRTADLCAACQQWSATIWLIGQPLPEEPPHAQP